MGVSVKKDSNGDSLEPQNFDRVTHASLADYVSAADKNKKRKR